MLGDRWPYHRRADIARLRSMTQTPTDQRLYAPAAARNRDAIRDVLARVLPSTGLVLEVASGSGEHIVHLARALPQLRFQPSDPDDQACRSIAAWIATEGLANVDQPVALDASAATWPIATADAVLCINMIHIAPWSAAIGLIQGAAAILPAGAPLCLYGPYQRDGQHTAPSNAAFDDSLRARNPAWGVRDLGAVTDLAQAAGFTAPEIIAMPANNLSLVFRRV
jgi:hypothetical protein